MKRFILICSQLLFLGFLVVPGQHASAQGTLDILNNAIDIQFPSGVVFALEAEQVCLFFCL